MADKEKSIEDILAGFQAKIAKIDKEVKTFHGEQDPKVREKMRKKMLSRDVMQGFLDVYAKMGIGPKKVEQKPTPTPTEGKAEVLKELTVTPAPAPAAEKAEEPKVAGGPTEGEKRIDALLRKLEDLIFEGIPDQPSPETPPAENTGLE